MTFTNENFEEEVLKSEIPVLVDYWAPWCGPCQLMGPIIHDLLVEYEGRAKVGKINTNENEALARSAGIRSIPCFKIYKGGVVVSEAAGTMSIVDLRKMLDAAL